MRPPKAVAATGEKPSVLVLGNGPVGQTCALLLARWGVSVTLLDARPRRDPIGSKAICQQRDVLDIWESVGVGHRLSREGLTWDSARTFYRGAELFVQTLGSTSGAEFPPFINISQARTEQILDEAIADEPSIAVHWGHQVTAIGQEDRHVVVRCQTSAGQVELRADYSVVCTGSRSDTIRRLLDVSFAGQSFDDRFLICDIRMQRPGWAHERRFYFDPPWNPGRQVLIHPCPDSVFRIDWQVPGDYDLESEGADGRLDARIRAIVGDEPYEIVWKSVYRFQSRVVDHMRRGRVLLAGDCAHVVAPFGARGLNSGVADAENAAWKLAYVIHGWADESLLDTYHAERHAAALENLHVTTTTMQFLVPQTAEQQMARESILRRALTDASAHALVDSGRLSEPFWYVDSPLVRPDPRRPFTGRPEVGRQPPSGPGRLVPDAPITMPGGGVTRLRRLARDGVLVLTGSGTDVEQIAAGVAEATSSPARVLAVSAIDPSGTLAERLGMHPDEVWIVRPDAYVAAVLSRPAATTITHAVRQSIGVGRRSQSMAGSPSTADVCN